MSGDRLGATDDGEDFEGQSDRNLFRGIFWFYALMRGACWPGRSRHRRQLGCFGAVCRLGRI